jgi:hypothetical protein
MAKYVYKHPEGAGLGASLAPDADLAGRDAQPPEVAASMRAALGVVNPTDDQVGGLDSFLSRSMADLDMPDGTEVELCMNDDPDDPDDGPIRHDGLQVVQWTDQHGDLRRTSVSDEVFDEYFSEVDE